MFYQQKKKTADLKLEGGGPGQAAEVGNTALRGGGPKVKGTVAIPKELDFIDFDRLRDEVMRSATSHRDMMIKLGLLDEKQLEYTKLQLQRYLVEEGKKAT